MKAIVATKAGPSLQTIENLTGTPRSAHVFVQMASARINPVDMDLAKGLPFAPMKTPIQVGGVDGAGTITAVGEGVSENFKVGDQVFIYRQFSNFGTWAETVEIPSSFVAKIPESMALEDAGAVSLTAPTAYYGLFRELKIEPGKKLLVLGGAGGVGFAAVQFAVDAGCKVYTNAGSPNSITKLEKLGGIERIINYKTEKLEECFEPGELDYIFDAAGKDSLSGLMNALKPGKLCSIKHPNFEAMAGVLGFELSWIWRWLFGVMGWWDNSTASKLGVELIGQVTPAGASPNLLAEVATKIDKMKKPFQAGGYKSIKLDELEGSDVVVDSSKVGKAILF